MNTSPLSLSRTPGLYRVAIQIAGVYLLFGCAWILFTDRMAASLASNPETLATINLYKGWVFVLLTALLLYWLIHRHTVRVHTSERRLQQVIDALPALIAYVDKARRYRLTNRAFTEWFGIDARGKPMEEVLGVTSYEQIAKYVDQVLQGEPTSHDSMISHRDGSTRYVHATYVPERMPNGETKGFFALVQDITERQRAQEELRQWADAFEGCAHGAAVCDPDTNRILVCNPAFASMYKCRVEDIVGASFLSLYAAGDYEHVRSHIQRADQIGISRFEATMVRKDHTIFPVQTDVVSVRGEGGELLRRVITAQDISERKQIEATLRSSQAQVAGVISSAMDAIISIDADQRIILFNPSAEKMFRCSQTEAIGQPLDRFLPERFREAHRKQVQYFGKTGITNRAMRGFADVVGLRNDGEEFPCEASISQMEVDGKKIYTVILRDVSERVEAEKNLRRFQLLSEHSRDIILFMDYEDGRILEANTAAIRSYGFTRDEILNLTLFDLVPRETKELTARHMDQANTQGIIFETIHRRKDGTTFPVEVSAQGATISGVRTLISIIRDITERKQIEQELKSAYDDLERKVQERTAALTEANALLQALMDYMPDHIYFKDTQSRFIRSSRSQATMLGLSDPSEAIGKTDFDFFPQAAQFFAQEQEVIRTGKPIVGLEEWVVWPDGRETCFSTTKLPLRNPQGETIGIFGISHDITERKRIEQEIRQLNADLELQAEQLRAANKELEAFSYSVSHDLRAPLRAIDGYTRILLEDYEPLLDEEGKRICGVISREARRMGQLIDDLLTFSRLGRKDLFTTGIDMEDLVRSVLAELVKDEDQQRIDLQIGTLPAVRGDASLIRQVWANLLDNALKFTSRKERAVIEVGATTSQAELIYYVRDNGAGFEMAYADKLFGVFQRLHSEREFSGTGVGLAIVQRIIHRHGGRVWAEGEVEKGATFYFALPRKESLS
jgi:PAS domain S-box-containing protein